MAVTIYDIAKATGFSITTVSKVLNNYPDVGQKTREKILKTVDEMGYFPSSYARTLTTKKSYTLGVIYMESLGIGLKHSFFSGIIQSFKQVVELEGYDLLFIANKIGDEKKSYLDHFKYRGVDGVVVFSSENDDEELDKVIDADLPSVIIDLDSSNTNVVHSDNYQGTELALQYLTDLGHKKIAHIAGHQNTFSGIERMKGFLKAMKRLDLTIPPSYIVNGGFFSIEGGREAMQQLLVLNERPTAVFASSDTMALGAIQVIQEAGLRVPEDISVIGYDNVDWSEYITPRLTTIRQDVDKIGADAAKILLNSINGKTKKYVKEVIPVTLVKRDSCSER
ncbi:HTH-type transcriptional repressor PurR [Halolactibacillus alkaliphilus]|uniref:HTH-type transcriptional repressor PurR n=1 Tax=Halolactibacillus alkaliphilus TaxID=442899 RepID=A0A511X079_9BACI|nr:LacI family DNA-binding transcriptional regulator [Halolactibacillus alkaliphilus]GEN56348.1 HTH-type transcriptional repressor PurR [Halolactibacillus alkaliphilus]GGN67584.1 HTH-type transcriptional repressor PurR [Halolactibacillus alkaliphilus]SFO78668.1 transcriptional regulator, LacI family [Halolactibacillus alkaliphilus]